LKSLHERGIVTIEGRNVIIQDREAMISICTG
jgi:hypothetical protein